MAKLITIDQKLNQAFQLAYFIHQDRTVARSVARDAASWLDTALSAQDKRLAYDSTNRNTITLSDDHMLQRLVMIASDPYERAWESGREIIDHKTLLIHFIKHLIRITFKLTPFYTTLGVCRILHNYSTSEAMEIDGIVMQNPDRVKDPSFFRARKKVLISELQNRFGDLLSQSKGPRQEIRFNSHNNPHLFLDLTRSCLHKFSPWFIKCINIPADYNPTEHVLDDLSSNHLNDDETQRIQLNRIHAVLDPECFSLLIKGLREHNMNNMEFNDPACTLQIPIFNIANDDPPDNGNRIDTSATSGLSDDELVVMRQEIEHEAAVRKQWGKGLLRIIVDGEERARLQPEKLNSINLRLKGGEELIEIRSTYQGEDSLLATKLLSYDVNHNLAETSFDLHLPNDNILSFDVTPETTSPDNYSPSNVSIKYVSRGGTQSFAQWITELVQMPAQPVFTSLANAFRKPVPALLAAASMALLIFFGVNYRDAFFGSSKLDEGMNALREAYKGYRPYESRISISDYSRFSVTRGSTDSGLNETAVRHVELALLEAINERDDARSRHAMGLFHLLNRDLDKAIVEFKKAVSIDPKDTKSHSDLGAALLEKGKEKRDSSSENKSPLEFGDSLKHLSIALAADPELREALFNRALCHEYLQMSLQAIDDWQKYLEVDPDSKWADEARQRLEALRQSQKQHSKNKELQLQNFYFAYHADDKEAVWEVISRNRELITESIIWQQLLNEYFENLANNSVDRADQALRALFYAGEVEEKKAGDSFVKELAIYYSGLPPPVRNKLTEAHNLMSEGNRHFINTDFDNASSKYTSATGAFQSLGNKWEALISRYLRAYCEILKANNSEPIALEQLLMESKAKSYPWFQAQVYNALGTCYTNITRTSEGIKNTTLSLDISEKINDHLGVQRNECELARQHLAVGATALSLDHLGRCMQSADRNWPGYRQMLRYYNTAGKVFLGMNNRHAAEAFSGAAFRVAKDEMRDRASIISTSLNLGDTYRKSGRNDEASRMYEISYKTAQTEPRIEAFRIREASTAAMLGNLYYDMRNYDRSVQYYTESVELHDQLDSVVNRYDALKGRFLAHVAAGNDTKAYADLEEIRKSSENYRKYIREEGHRNTFFSLEQEFTDAAIDFLYSRNEVEKSFELSEATRARSLLDLISSQARITSAGNSPEFILESVTEPRGVDYIQPKLPEKALILQYAVLKEKIIIWVVSRYGINHASFNISESEITAKVKAYKKYVSDYKNSNYSPSLVRSEAESLYKILIGPVEKYLDPRMQICIVPDKILNYLPFSTLVKPGQDNYLIEDHSITFMPSSTVYLHCTVRAAELMSRPVNERLMSVGVSTLDREKYKQILPLPNAGDEANLIAKYYVDPLKLVNRDARKHRILSELRKSDVIHIASHYIVDEKSPMKSRLLLTHEVSQGGPSNGMTDTLQADEIYSEYKRVRDGSRTRLAVLSACDSGIEGYYSGEGMIGMSRIFIASNIPLVVASLWKVDSHATEALMVNFHKHRRQGQQRMATADALRCAQRDLIKTGDALHGRPGYWAGFMVIGGYANF